MWRVLWLDNSIYCECYISYFLYLPESINSIIVGVSFECFNVAQYNKGISLKESIA